MMECKVINQIFDGFYCILENWSKSGQKTDSLTHFDRFFVYALLHPANQASGFWQKKELMKIHNADKFHWYSICGCQVLNFQMFSYQCNIPEKKKYFLGGALLPQITLDYVEIITKNRENKKNVSKILTYAKTVRTQSLQFQSIFGSNLTPTKLRSFWIHKFHSRLYSEDNPTLFGSGPNWVHSGVFF